MSRIVYLVDPGHIRWVEANTLQPGVLLHRWPVNSDVGHKRRGGAEK